MTGCDNCGIKKAGLVDMATGRLCLDCYERFQNARNSAVEQDMAKISELTAMMSHYEEVMDYQLGFRLTPPKFNPPMRSQAVNQNINFSNNWTLNKPRSNTSPSPWTIFINTINAYRQIHHAIQLHFNSNSNYMCV